jgi:hypothetical protein
VAGPAGRQLRGWVPAGHRHCRRGRSAAPRSRGAARTRRPARWPVGLQAAEEMTTSLGRSVRRTSSCARSSAVARRGWGFAELDALRVEHDLPVHQFCATVGLPVRTYYDRRVRHRDGGPSPGPWPTPAHRRVAEAVIAMALAFPMPSVSSSSSASYAKDATARPRREPPPRGSGRDARAGGELVLAKTTECATPRVLSARSRLSGRQSSLVSCPGRRRVRRRVGSGPVCRALCRRGRGGFRRSYA